MPVNAETCMEFYNKGYADGIRAARRDIGRDFGASYETGHSVEGSVGPVKVKVRKKNKWNLFLKRFKFRAKKKRESPSNYFRLRVKAASRAFKRKK